LAYDTAASEISDLRSQIAFAEGDDDDPNRAERVGDKLGIDIRFDVPPREAIDYFKRKKILPADEFYRLEVEARSGAFAIGRVYRTDVTAALQKELVDALERGRTQRDVINRLKAILQGAGHAMLGDAHLETVFRTATQMAYGVGRRIAQEEAAEYLPVWEYSAVGDDRTRPTHMALDGLQFPTNHPFWNRYYPPWDFRCRCTVIPVFDFRKGYNAARPNGRTVWEMDADGMPKIGNVDGTPITLRHVNFVGVPPNPGLERVLKESAERALDSRKKPS
jgi:SPP1 gp7 family putative phage head morphogenesis protein